MERQQCIICRLPLPDGARFCGVCGYPVSPNGPSNETQEMPRLKSAKISDACTVPLLTAIGSEPLTPAIPDEVIELDPDDLVEEDEPLAIPKAAPLPPRRP